MTRLAALRLPVALLACVLASGCGASSRPHATTAQGQAAPAAAALATTSAGGGWSASFTAPTHTPRVNEAWTLTIAATRAGRPLAGTISYVFLVGGQVVARRGHYRFSGTFHNTINWPGQSAGYPLTFRAVVHTALGVKSLDYLVRVQP